MVYYGHWECGGTVAMTERMFRIFLGAGLFILLYLSAINGRKDLVPVFIGLLVFEGLTNWRIPVLITRLQTRIFSQANAPKQAGPVPSRQFSIPFEAERAMRLVIASILVIPWVFSADILWVIPWFVASMLLLAGVTNICPIVMFFRWLGFK